jgi:hypothetical protein
LEDSIPRNINIITSFASSAQGQRRSIIKPPELLQVYFETIQLHIDLYMITVVVVVLYTERKSRNMHLMAGSGEAELANTQAHPVQIVKRMPCV